MNAAVNRRSGSATLSGVRLTPTLAPRARSSIACSEASGFKGLKVSFVYKFVYSTTAVRQSCRPEESEAQRDPGRSAGGEDPDYARRKVPKGDSGKAP